MKTTLAVAIVCCSLATTPVVAQHEGQHHADSHGGPGPHLVDAFFTEHAFIERKIRADFSFMNTDDWNRFTGQIEVEWAISPNAALIVRAPMHYIDRPESFDNSGVGDIALGSKLAVVNNQDAFILAVGAELTMPTGNAARGLGSEHAWAGPFALAWLPFGPDRRWTFQTASHLEIPFAGDEGAEAEVATALSWTSPLGVTPTFETISVFPLGGGGASWWAAPGFRWSFFSNSEMGASLRIPVTGPEAAEENIQIVLGFIRHFPVPR